MGPDARCTGEGAVRCPSGSQNRIQAGSADVLTPAGLDHLQQFIRGEAALRPTLTQSFLRDPGTDYLFPAIQTVGTCVQVTPFRISPGSFGGGLRWG